VDGRARDARERRVPAVDGVGIEVLDVEGRVELVGVRLQVWESRDGLSPRAFLPFLLLFLDPVQFLGHPDPPNLMVIITIY